MPVEHTNPFSITNIHGPFYESEEGHMDASFENNTLELIFCYLCLVHLRIFLGEPIHFPILNVRMVIVRAYDLK